MKIFARIVLRKFSTILIWGDKMQNKYVFYQKEMPDAHFCVDIIHNQRLKLGESLNTHWHEQLQFFYFCGGKALLECGKKRFIVAQGDVAVINSNEPHYLECLSDDLDFYVIRIDPSFLFSNQVDLVQTKYISPLSQNRISFQNRIENDKQISDCVIQIIEEYEYKQIGFELAVKSSLYQLIVLLLRGYVARVITKDEFQAKVNTLKQFDRVFEWIEANYMNKVTLPQLAETVNISSCHFCRLFKQITGKTTTEYINGVRLEKSIAFLKQKDLNITEIALECGFDSVNYFSRLFRKCYHVSPTKFRDSSGSYS